MFGFFQKNTDTQDDNNTMKAESSPVSGTPHVITDDTTLKKSIADKLKGYIPSDRTANFNGTRI
ncbi:MAG: hypothetical protein COA42_00860 [Alteromonadaceae bacterium]|nr:MAG: hypothetical protein COA42_00860 [Alteromonadaceae bacterium]